MGKPAVFHLCVIYSGRSRIAAVTNLFNRSSDQLFIVILIFFHSKLKIRGVRLKSVL